MLFWCKFPFFTLFICHAHGISVSVLQVSAGRVCGSVWVYVRVCTCVQARVFSQPSQYLEPSVAWTHYRGTMSELEQLRQEAEQLRNQIQVRQYFVLIVYKSHLWQFLFTANWHTLNITCQLNPICFRNCKIRFKCLLMLFHYLWFILSITVSNLKRAFMSLCLTFLIQFYLYF